MKLTYIAPLSWKTGDGDWDTVANNWLDTSSSSPAAYVDGATPVLFADATGVSGNPTVTVNSNFSPFGGVTMSSTLRDYTISGSGSISGTGTQVRLPSTNTRTLTLSTANTYTGATTVNGGTLKLDYSSQDNTKLSDTAVLNLGGGTLNLSGGTHTEIVLSTTLTANTSSFVTQTGGTATLQMGVITRNAGAFIDFGAPGIATTSSPNNSYGILGTWAMINGSDYAVNSTNAADGLITAPTYTDVTRLNGGTQVIADASASFVRISEGTGSAANITLGAGTTSVATLTQSIVDGTSAAVIDPAGQTLATNAILVASGAGSLTIGNGANNGNVQAFTAAGDLSLNTVGAGTLTINSAILDNGGSTLTKLGTGTLILNGANTYTGATAITAGTLRLSGAGTLGVGSSVSVSSGALLDLNGTNQSIKFVAGTGVGTVANNSGSGTSILTLAGTATINGGLVTIVDNTNSTSGTVAVVITANTQPLSNLNTYSGGTTVNAGAFLYLIGSAPLGAGTGPITLTTATTGVGTGSGLVVDGVTYANDITGAGYVHNNSTGTSTTVFTGNLTTSGPFIFRGGTGITFNFAGNGTTSVLSGVIGTGTSSVNGAVVTGKIIKSGTGTLTLSGANTYTLGTTLSAGVLNINSAGVAATNGPLGNGGTFAINGGTIDNTSGTANVVLNVNPITVGGDFAYSTSGGTGSNDLTLPGTVNLGGTTRTITTNGAGTLTLSGAISSGALNKAGVGTLTLSGANTYTGVTTINAGTLGVSGGGAIVNAGLVSLADAAGATFQVVGSETIGALTGGGATGGAVSIDAAQTLSLSSGTQTYAGTVSGSGTLTNAGAIQTLNGALSHSGGVNVTLGTLTLGSSSNTYAGTTAISAAAAGIIVTANNALGAIGVGNETTVGANGVLGFSGGITYSALEKITGSGAGNAASGTPVGFAIGSRGFIQSVSGSNTFAGDIEVTAASRIGTQDGAQLTLTGVITQTVGNILFRVGNNAGDFVTLSNAGNSFGGDSTVFTGATVGNYAGVRLGITNGLPTNLTISGFAGTGAGAALDLAGFNQSLNGLITGGAAMSIINMNTGSPSTLTLNPTANQTTTNTLILGGGGLGVISVEKDGAFTQTLSGANTHTGTTTVIGGTLELGNVNAVQASTLNTGTAGAQTVTFSVAGTNTYNLGGLSGADDLNAGTNSLSVGANNANTTFTGIGTAATFTKVGTGTLDLNGASQAFGTLATNDGTVNINGTLGSGTSVVTVTDTAGGAATKLRFGTVSQTLNSLTIGAGATVIFTSGTASGAFSGGGGKGASLSGSAVVPEPGTIGLLLVGALGVLNRRRRQA